MTGNTEKITKGEDYLGRSCVVCKREFQAEDEVVACPRCHSVHHAECWKEKGGCGKTGCPQVARTIRGERPQGDGPPPPVSKKVIAGGILASVVVILLMVFWPKPPDPAMGRTKIVFLGPAYQELSDVVTELVEGYNATSEDVYIDLQLLPPQGMDTKLVVLIAANQAPDVLAIDDDRFAQFSSEGALLPVGVNDEGEPIYGIQHPAQLTQLVVWGGTENPAESLEVLHFLAKNIPPADLDLLRESQTSTFPF